MYLYEIRNKINSAVYVGITRSSLKQRWRGHLYSARSNKKSILYDAMRSIGEEHFYILEIKSFDTEADLLQSEKDLIKYHREFSEKCYNILDGGESYFPIYDWETHKAKLRIARAGRKPALGMKHTEENKKAFGEFGKLRWDLYGRYPDDVVNYSFKEASAKFGISKTHYYRLRKLAENNELS